MEKICVIFGAGEVFPPRRSFAPTDLIIAADGGYRAAIGLGLEPAVVIGDFDSGEQPAAAHVIKLNVDKDETDMLAAVKLGLRRGYRTFALYGGVGGRSDHTVANLAVLRYLNNFDAHGYLVDRDSVCTVITEEKLTVPCSAGTVSVFAYGGAAGGVTLTGMKFPLKNATLTPDFPLGISNNIIAAPAAVSVKTGSLLVFFAR